MFSSIHLLTNDSPGSDISGVPASEIILTIRPACNLFIIFGISFEELNLWKDFRVFFIPYFDVNFLLVLVSSHNISEDKASIDNARIEISDKLPIGVDTMYNPGRKLFLFIWSMMAVVLMLIFIKFIHNLHINHNIILLLVIPFLFYACETAPYKNDLYTNKIIDEIEKTSLNDDIEIIKDLKIGLLLPLSGEKSKVGKSLLRASQLSLNKANNKNIKLFVQDTEDPYKNIISSYYELIGEDVDIILGPLFSENIKLIAPIALDHKTIMITPSNNTEIKNTNIFISGLTPENEIT